VNKKLYLHEWFLIFLLLSSIAAVLLVATFKRKVIKNQIISASEKDFIVEKSDFLLFFPPMNRSTAGIK
jgi:divalent metal cation (Fe/Co/Zn/Cd) transporter